MRIALIVVPVEGVIFGGVSSERWEVVFTILTVLTILLFILSINNLRFTSVDREMFNPNLAIKMSTYFTMSKSLLL